MLEELSKANTPGSGQEGPRGGRLLKTAVFLTLVLAFSTVLLAWDRFPHIGVDQFRHILERSGPLAPLLYMAVMALAVVISPLPSLPLDIAAGRYFGPLLGTLYSSLGALAGATASFLIARLLGRELVPRLVRGHIIFCASCSDRLMTKIVFLSRLLPVVSFDLVSYGAGLTGMSLWKFATATFLGMLPLTFLYNYFGHVFMVHRAVTVLGGAAVVALFFLVPRWIERRNLFSLRHLFEHPQGPDA